jgi:hypothetical protein
VQVQTCVIWSAEIQRCRGDRIRTCDFFVPKDDILAEAAGITAGSWYASPATHIGYELIGAGMLTLAGGGRGTPLDYHELERCTRVGYERGMRSRKGER